MKKVEKNLDKILLPLNSCWKISDVQLHESTDEVNVSLSYDLPYIEANGLCYIIYDHRPSRNWRHLDLWQYKTYITAVYLVTRTIRAFIIRLKFLGENQVNR